MREVGRGIDLEQAIYDAEISPWIDAIKAGHGGGRDHEKQVSALETMTKALDQVERERERGMDDVSR